MATPGDYDVFHDAAQSVLRHWFQMDFDIEPWRNRACLSEFLAVESRQVDETALREAIRALVQSALDRLSTERPDLADLLRTRYREGATLGELAVETKRTLDQVRHLQTIALDTLANTLVAMEQEAHAARQGRILTRLDTPAPPRVFGQDAKFNEALSVLRRADSHFLVALQGLGGIGKTTLADRLVRALTVLPDFADILWVSARSTLFSFRDGIQPDSRHKPALSYQELIQALAEPLGITDARTRDPAECVRLARAAMQARPYLVVIDNLETVEDHAALVPDLLRLVRPSKFLLTTRQSLHGFLDVYTIKMDELPEPDLLEMMRHEARMHGLSDWADLPASQLHRIYDVIGGNPLAAKLVVGQAHFFSLDKLLDELLEARGKSADDLYQYIYWASWHALSPDAQQLLQTMPLVGPAGGEFDQLAAASQLSEEATRSALRELLRSSLVNTVGNLQQQRYSIHRLTETFLMHEVLKWASQ